MKLDAVAAIAIAVVITALPPSLALAQHSAAANETRSIPFGVSFIRVVDGVDLADPVAAAEGRSVFELRPVA